MTADEAHFARKRLLEVLEVVHFRGRSRSSVSAKRKSDKGGQDRWAIEHSLGEFKTQAREKSQVTSSLLLAEDTNKVRGRGAQSMMEDALRITLESEVKFAPERASGGDQNAEIARPVATQNLDEAKCGVMALRRWKTY